MRVIGDDDAGARASGPSGAGYWRLKGLSADVVILNEHPSSYLDEMHAQLTALLDNGPWRTWKHRSGGAYLLRGDRLAARSARCSKPSRGRSSVGTEATSARNSTNRIRSRTAASGVRGRCSSPKSTVRRPSTPHAAANDVANGLGGFTDEGRPTRSSWRATRKRHCPGRTSSRTPTLAPS